MDPWPWGHPVTLCPGCPWCILLRRRLRRHGVTYREINIWRDDGARALVRAAAGGNETVPTVHVNGRWLVNPCVDEVVSALGARN